MGVNPRTGRATRTVSTGGGSGGSSGGGGGSQQSRQLTPAQRRANIEKALARVRAAKQSQSMGPTGGTEIVVDARTGRAAIVKRTPANLRAIEIGRKAAIKQRQSSARQREVSTILKKQGNKITLDKSGVMVAQKGNTRKVISTLGNITRVPIKKKVSIVDTKQRQFQKLKKDISSIRELEKQAAKRSERAADIFRAVPLLKGDNFAQKTARALLAIPARATFGVGEQAVISGFKLSANIRGLQLAPKATKEESGRAVKQVPITIARGFDPRTPEGLANIIATVIAFKLGGKSKASTKQVRSGIKSTAGKLTKLGKNKPASFKATIKATTRGLKRAAKQKGFVNKVRTASGSIKRSIVRQLKARKTLRVAKKVAKVKLKTVKRVRKITSKSTAREIIRKIENNKLGLKRAVRLKAPKKSIARLKAGTRSLQKRLKLTKTSKVQQAIIRRSIKKGLRPKKQTFKFGRKTKSTKQQRIKSAVTKRLKSSKRVSKAQLRDRAVKIIERRERQLLKVKRKETGVKSARAAEGQLVKELTQGKIKLTSEVRASIRKLVRKEIRQRAKGGKGLVGEELSVDTLIENLEKMRKGVQELRSKRSVNIEEVARRYKQVEIQSKKLTSIKRGASKPTIKKINKAQNTAKTIQKQLQSEGQQTIQLLKKKTITKTKVQLKKASPSKAQNIKTKFTKVKTVLKKQATAARSLKLPKLANAIARQIVLLNPIIAIATKQAAKRLAKRKVGQLAAAKSAQKKKSKKISKQTPVQKQKQDKVVKTIAIPKSELSSKTDSQLLKIISSVLIPLAAVQAFRIRGNRVNIKQTRLRGGIRKARTFIFNRLRKKRRAFTPDIYSLIFGIRAKPGERIQLLRPGRVFTGAERRSQVR